MKFKLDENLPTSVVEVLRAAGHDAHSVFDEKLEGAADLEIADACQLEQRILLTLDLDFADIRHYPPHLFHGIIVMRPAKQDVRTLLLLMSRILELSRTESVERRLWIVDENKTRVRG